MSPELVLQIVTLSLFGVVGYLGRDALQRLRDIEINLAKLLERTAGYDTRIERIERAVHQLDRRQELVT